MLDLLTLGRIDDPRFRGLRNMVGNTPLLAIHLLYQGERRTIYAKAENLNLTGSIKDRMALHILRKAARGGHVSHETPPLSARDTRSANIASRESPTSSCRRSSTELGLGVGISAGANLLARSKLRTVSARAPLWSRFFATAIRNT